MSLLLPKPVKRVKVSAPRPTKRQASLKRGSRPRRRRKGSKAAVAREADRLWSLIVRHRGACEAEGNHAGVLQAAHGFSRRYRNARWLPINGFCLCAGHHLTFTYDPLAWDDFLRRAWGEPVYCELKSLAQKTSPPDVASALAKLKEEAASLGLSLCSRDVVSTNGKGNCNNLGEGTSAR